MSFHEQEYREIITKAVCGSGRKRIKTTDYVVPADKPTSILGCWIINHRYYARRGEASTVEVHGTYDINIWYSHDGNTRTEVVKDTIEYCDKIELSDEDLHCFHHEDEVMAKVIRQPNCLECKIEDGGKIAVDIEREFTVNVIGETKVQVKVEPPRSHGHGHGRKS